MRLDRSEVDIDTLVSRIRSGQIDIQPNFQRGEVWPELKKKRLIDTILRDWYIPAIHIVVDDARDSEEVLDGQQRLRAIMEFMEDGFSVDGSLEPSDPHIRELHGRFYSELPAREQSRFRRFPISTVRLREFEPEEPGELFFRLNQLTALTSAEQRNALIGEPRNQVKDLVTLLETRFSDISFGFSNFRLAYDEVLARLVASFESGDLKRKITGKFLEDRYRKSVPFSSESVRRSEFSIEVLGDIYSIGIYSKLNKASLFSWLFFIGDRFYYNDDFRQPLPSFFNFFEGRRSDFTVDPNSIFYNEFYSLAEKISSPLTAKCIAVFNDRSFARVNDVSSILLRDFALNVSFADFCEREFSQTHFGRAFVPEGEFKEFAALVMNLPDIGAGRALAEAELSERWGLYREARQA